MVVSLYELLEVSPNASAAVIKAAYRCLVQQHHPDKNSGDRASETRLSLKPALSLYRARVNGSASTA